MRPPEHPALSALLLPLAAVYGLAVRIRNARFDRGIGVVDGAIPVVSVGNLTVGGTGKTPFVVRLARELAGEGRRPAVVSRGYGGRAGRGPVVVSRGSGPEVSAEIGGDEPVMLASRLPGVPVLVGSDRVLGVGAARDLGADVAILDDGFQHRRLGRALDIVVVDAARPVGNGRLLPAGPLREPPASLARAGLVVAMEREPGSAAGALRVLRAVAPGVPWIAARKAPAGFFLADGRPAGSPERAIAFCGIGAPSSFRSDLELAGVALDAFHAMDDHHPFTAAELTGFHEESVAAGVPLVTTEKDLARVAGRSLPKDLAERLLVLRVEVRTDDDALRAALARALAAVTS